MNRIKQMGLSLLLSVSLSACDINPEKISVIASQINYTDKTITHVEIAKLKDPNLLPFKETVRKRVLPIDENPAEAYLYFIDRNSTLSLLRSHPYSQGDFSCCLDLPEKWQPNMRYLVRVKPVIESVTEEKKSKEENTYYYYIIEIPEYTPTEYNKLYVLVLPENKIEVIVSDVEPSDENWNGKTKPSYEYELAQWERANNYYKLFADTPSKYSDEYYKESWRSYNRFEPEKVAVFKNYKDPAYRVFTDNDSFKGSWRSMELTDKDKLKEFKNSQDPAFRQYIDQKERESEQDWKQQLEDWQKYKPKKASAQ